MDENTEGGGLGDLITYGTGSSYYLKATYTANLCHFYIWSLLTL